MDQNFFFLFHPLSNIEITKNLSYEPRFNVVFSRDNLPRMKDGVHISNLHDKKVKENISFHYLLTKTQLLTLIFLGLNIFHNKYYEKSKIKPSLKRCFENNLMTLIESDRIYAYRKTFVRSHQFIFS